MSTKTTNYEFIKPELTDSADITATNGNWDKLDKKLKEHSEHTHTAEDVHALPDTTQVVDIGAKPGQNLLHNWYFGNPVNRLGLTTYEDSVYKPTIDRWRSDGLIKLVVNNSNVSLQHRTGTTSYAWWWQNINSKIAQKYIGRQLTFSVLVDSVEGAETTAFLYDGRNSIGKIDNLQVGL